MERFRAYFWSIPWCNPVWESFFIALFAATNAYDLIVGRNRVQVVGSLQKNVQVGVAIIGGGETSPSVALDAVSRGVTVALFESHDFAKGTSSRAIKLVHGGVRYLAKGNIALVREALHERTTLLANAPHLAQLLAFVMPSYTW